MARNPMDLTSAKIHVLISEPFLPKLLANGVEDPYARYADLRRAGAVLRDASGILLVTRHREAARIIAHPGFAFVGAQAFPAAGPKERAQLAASGFLELLMFRGGASHSQTRRALSAIFSSDQMGRVRVAAEAKALELSLGLGGGFRVVETTVSALPISVLAVLIGIAESEILSLVAGSRMLAGLLAAAPMKADALVASLAEFESLVAKLDKRLTEPAGGDDPPHPLAGLLLTSAAADRRAIIADVLVLLVTGHDTSRAMLGNAVAALIAHPEACAMLAAEPALAPRAAEELIRYDTPGQVVFRHALEDAVIGEHQIRRGEMLALLIGSANHDETVFEQPDRLDFARTAGRPLSFGAGPHACIGAAIAKIQLTAFLKALVPQLPGLALDGTVPKAQQHGLIRGHEWPEAHSPAHAMRERPHALQTIATIERE